MAAFYTCSVCERDFLGRDTIPIHEGEHVKPVCERCWPGYDICIVCSEIFLLESTEDPGKDLCQSCWAGDITDVEGWGLIRRHVRSEPKEGMKQCTMF